MTEQDMVKAIVESSLGKDKFADQQTIRVYEEAPHIVTFVNDKKRYFFEQLLFDPNFMKAVYGDKSCQILTGDLIIYKEPAYTHYALEALKLFHDRDARMAIIYLYDNLPKETDK